MDNTKEGIRKQKEESIQEENNTEAEFSLYDADIDEDLEALDVRERYQTF